MHFDAVYAIFWYAVYYSTGALEDGQARMLHKSGRCRWTKPYK